MQAAIETLIPNEISKILKLHPFTVTRFAKEGQPHFCKKRAAQRMRRDDMISYLDMWKDGVRPK